MRVLLANKFFFRNGGSEAVMFMERESLIKSGIEVVDFSMTDDRNIESPHAEYFVSKLSYRNGGHASKVSSALSLIHSQEAVRKISRLIDATRPDVMHCHNIYHQLTPSIIRAAKSFGVPVFLTLHDYKLVCPVYTRLSNGKRCSACIDGDFSHVIRNRCSDGSLAKSAILYAEAIIQRFWKNYDKVDYFLAPSAFMRDVVSRRIPAQKIILLRNGIDISKMAPVERDDGYVLYIGRLSPEKGVETLLRSYTGRKGTWPLVVAGAGPMLDTVRGQFPEVEFTGHLTGDGLCDKIAGASVIVVPSEWEENCPMSVLEAMAFGKPVVASRIGGIPELVRHENTGLLFEPGNHQDLSASVDRLMNNSSLRRKMGSAGRLHAELNYSAREHNARLVAAYRSVCNVQ